MTASGDSSIELVCQRCFLRIEVARDQLGMKQVCPRCQLVLEVADGNRPLKSIEPYDVQTAERREHPVQWIAVDCQYCGTRMHATPDQVGTAMACPDCHMPAVVRPPQVKGTAKAGRPAETSVDLYALRGEDVSGQSETGDNQPRLISVWCPLCGTLMHAGEDQVGQTITCPDCRTSTVVLPPQPNKVEPTSAAAAAPDGISQLAEELVGGGDHTYIPFECRLCRTRLYALETQAGQTMVCPDCGVTTTVPPLPAGERVRDPRREIDGEYAVGSAPTTPEYSVPPDYRQARMPPPVVQEIEEAIDEQEAEEEEPRRRRRPPPPQWPMFSGVFNFPFSDDVWRSWVGLSAAGAVILPLAWGVLLLLGGVYGREYAIAGVAFMLLLIVVGLSWMSRAASLWLAIVHGTAAGYDGVDETCEGMAEGLVDVLYVLSSLVVSAVLGSVIGLLAARVELHGIWLAPVVAWLLWPVVLLSMLEEQSPLCPLGWRVCLSLVRQPVKWGLFYVESTLVAIAAAVGAGGIAAALNLWDWLEKGFVGSQLGQFAAFGLASAAATGLLMGASIIYFRLLGRLAWWCEEGESDEEDQEDEEDEDE